jgi:hypothetical protein
MSYSQRQIMVSLAYLAYTDQLLPGIPSPDSQIKTDLTNALLASGPIPPVAGQWSLVWGPVSYTVPGSLYQDNLMYVAQCNDTASPQYAIAIRGTDGKVLLDWLLEDFDILVTMPWPLGATPANAVGNISESTSIALTTLLSMVDPVLQLTLFQFLTSEMQKLTAPPASVCFTGHSLGATLASALALHARDIQASWDPSSKAIVTTINFAGPTAGDSDFAAYFDKQFTYTAPSPLTFWQSEAPSTSSPSYADCVRTSLDIAPLVWNNASMNQIENIYWGPHIVPEFVAPVGTAEIVADIQGATLGNDYTQVSASEPDIPGQLIPADQLPPGLSTNNWIAEATYQHRMSYPILLGVPSILVVFPPAFLSGRPKANAAG